MQRIFFFVLWEMPIFHDIQRVDIFDQDKKLFGEDLVVFCCRAKTNTHAHMSILGKGCFFLQMDGAKKCNIYTINNLAKALIC